MALGLNRPTEGDRANRPTRKMTLEDSQGHGRLNVQGIEEDKDYYYHVVSDKNNRVYQLQQRGYEIVKQDGKIVMGDCNPKEVGDTITTTCDDSNGTKGVLMRIRREWKEEDDAYRQEQVAKTEEALFRTLKDEGQYGEVKIEKARK
jgi:hypothetical protein